MKKRLVLLLFLCVTVLCGCGSRILEEELLVIVMGIDADAEKGITLSVKVPNGNGGGGGDSSGGKEGGDSYLTLTATGKDLESALSLLSAGTPRVINFSQTREVLFGKEAAGKEHYGKLLRILGNMPRLRRQSTVIICKEKASDFMEAQEPDIGTLLSRYIEISLENYAQNGFVPTTTLSEALLACDGGLKDALLMLGAVAPKEAVAPESDTQPVEFFAGDIEKKSKNKVELLGAATTDGQQVTGYLTGYQTALYHLLLGRDEDMTFRFSDGYGKLSARTAAALSVNMARETPLLEVHVHLTLKHTASVWPSEESACREVEKEIKKMIQTLQLLRCDALGFSEKAISGVMTQAQWKKMDFKNVYPKADVSVQVSLSMETE